MVLGLELAIPGAFWQHEHLRADDDGNADGGLSHRHSHSVLNLTLIMHYLCVLEVPTAQRAVGDCVGRVMALISVCQPKKHYFLKPNISTKWHNHGPIYPRLELMALGFYWIDPGKRQRRYITVYLTDI